LSFAKGEHKEKEGPEKREELHVSPDVTAKEIDLLNVGNYTSHLLNMPCNVFCPHFAEKTVQHMLESSYSDRQLV
jgi:hypothetical protein